MVMSILSVSGPETQPTNGQCEMTNIALPFDIKSHRVNNKALEMGTNMNISYLFCIMLLCLM